MSATLLIVEDDEMIRLAVASGLRLDGFAVHEAENLSTARDVLQREPVDLLLLDVELPDGNGLEILADLRARSSPMPVLMLTARGSEEDRVFGFEHGCDDYVVKPFSLKELRLRIAALLRRAGAPSTPRTEVLGIGDHIEVDLHAYRLIRHGEELRLSPKERDMLRLFLRKPGEVLSRETFLKEVWGYERSPITRTVDMHVRKLREKIEADPETPRHLVTVHGAGYRLDP